MAAHIAIDPTTEIPAQLPKIKELTMRAEALYVSSLVQLPALGPVAGADADTSTVTR